MRVLMLADDCNPEWPSLPVVGYKAAKSIASLVDLVVITHVRNRENIERCPIDRAQIRYVDNEYIAAPLYKLAKWMRGDGVAWTSTMALAYPSYLAFEREAWKSCANELKRGEFDLVHRITPMSPTLPSPFAKWSPIPFIIGPLNGGLKWPPTFRKEQIKEREWLSFIRDAFRILPYQRATYERSTAILAAFKHTINDLPVSRAPTMNFPEVGVDPVLFHHKENRGAKASKVFLFAGRLVPYKLPHVPVEAFARCEELRKHRLIIAGEGPEKRNIERIILDNNLENCVHLVGWRSQAEISALMRDSDVFVFPSIRELGAGVVVEAMASGLACVVVDYGAPATLIDHDRGIKVSLSTTEELISEFSIAMQRLVSEPKLASQLGAAAKQHAAQFYTWDAKAKKTLQVYNWAMGNGPKPNFWAE